ncbi:carboxypeptidase regulatory-like domain-containing protein [Candidatus Palauibacter sp.]|uniref:carboxypeptidase regulatory-like domain-containing protein n=1 Tax=Candidatus Palauibacter sp. TaxID=3101350 RepID=UPI003B02AC95
MRQTIGQAMVRLPFVGQGAALALVLSMIAAPPVAGQEQMDCDGRASLHVLVTEESGLMQLPGATVVLEWNDVVLRPIRRSAEADGSFALCVPADAQSATVWAEFGDDSSEEAAVTFEPGTTQQLQLRVLFGEAEPGRIVGRVLDAATNRSVETVALSLSGRAQEVQTDRRGRFAIAGVPAGEHRIEARRLGYADLASPVTVTRGLTTELEIRLVPAPREMEPIVVTAVRPRRLEVGGFYERKYYGELVSGGTFFTLEDIDRRRPVRITHMLADAPGIRLRCPGSGFRDCWVESSRAASVGGCELRGYLDGSPVPVEDLDSIVLPVEVAGIEVYQGPAQLPPEFAGYDARCGAVVIWTK